MAPFFYILFLVSGFKQNFSSSDMEGRIQHVALFTQNSKPYNKLDRKMSGFTETGFQEEDIVNFFQTTSVFH
jgi:hypothetical protein